VGWSCGTNGKELCILGFVDKLSRRLLGRSKHRREDGIIIKELGGGEDWINLALGRYVHVVGWKGLSTPMVYRFPFNAGVSTFGWGLIASEEKIRQVYYNFGRVRLCTEF